MAKAAVAGNAQGPMPGAYFDVPGIPGGSTQWTLQDETTTNAVTTLSASVQSPVQNIANFQQTDVVCDWQACFHIAQTYTGGTGQTITASAYAPYNQIGPTKLTIQNQYASLDVESGIDWYIFNLLRPFRNSGIHTNNYWYVQGDAVGSTALGYATTAIAQVDQINSAQWSTSVASYNLFLRIPAGQWFDQYYDLAVTGEPLAAPHPAIVSPQFMAGTTRVIAPTVMYNPGFGATSDIAPATTTTLTPTSDTASTFAGTATLRFRRRASYAGNQAIQPPAYAWQYRWKTQRFGNIQGASQANLLVPLDTGQLLAIYVRMFDPSAAAGVGAPVNINTITRFQLQYGSGLSWFDAQTVGGTTAAALVQQLWYDQHNVQLPPGVLAFDLAVDERLQMSNKRCLNTLTTAGIQLHIEFTGTNSATAYAVMGLESLVYVT